MAKKQSAIDKLLGRNNPEPEPEPIQSETEENPEVEEFMEIGGSPVPGITLRQVLRGHRGQINHVAWSPDGRFLASTSWDETIRIWDVERGECIAVLNQDHDDKNRLAWSPDGRGLVAVGNELAYWNIQTKSVVNAPNVSGYDLAVSPDGQSLVVAESFRLRRFKLPKLNETENLHNDSLTHRAVIWSKQRGILFCSHVYVYNMNVSSKEITLVIEGENEVEFIVDTLTLSPNESTLAVAIDKTLKIWDFNNERVLSELIGHTDTIETISFSNDGKILVSSGSDGCRFWRTDTWQTIAILGEVKSAVFNNLTSHQGDVLLASHGQTNTIYIWSINYNLLISSSPTVESIRYTTAKLVLVGDSGVGKTGLGWRLAHNEFKVQPSTHGQQFWVIPELGKKRSDGTECEAVLWDVAGQHIYRSIHSIFLDNVDASLVLFDASNRQDPLKGVEFWLNQLAGKAKLPPSVLVGAKVDVSPPVLTQSELDQVCKRYGISGGYISTSAKSGEGVDKLLESLKEQIPWDQMTTTVTTGTFKKIKDYVLSLKEKPDRKGVLVSPDELRSQLQITDNDWQFTDAEMMTAVGHLANHGYVTILKSSSGEEFILLVPELLASVAASIFLHADKHPRELGAINETELLLGKYSIDEFKGLEKEEQQVLLDATVVRFLEHSICFRETLGKDNLLIFPSLIKQKRPLKDDIPSTDDISYIVRGRVENIYAVLVVLLGYTPSFTRINQWANQAQYETDEGNICGFRLVEDREGEIELILYYGNDMPDEERNDFQALFEQFLYQRDVDVTPFPPVQCSNGHRQERATVVKSLREGKKAIFCYECGAKTDLPDLEAKPDFGFEAPDWLKREEALARLRNAYETNLVNVKGYRRSWATPRCYISFADEQREFAERLARDLADAGIFVKDEDTKIDLNDNIIVIDSPSYKKAWESNALQDDIRLIRPRLADDRHKGLIHINQAGLIAEHTLKLCVSKAFCDPTHYVINLFDLVLHLYAIPINHAGFMPLRQSLHTQWEQTLAQKTEWKIATEELTSSTDGRKKEIFFSYAWRGESENIVNDIDQAFQKRGVTIVRDKRDLGYRGSIKEFMERIGRGQAVVVVISDKYLKSKNCMFELIQIAENKQLKDRIFPVVLGDADIYDSVKRIEYIKYWEAKKKELDTAIKSVGSEKLQGIRDDMDLYDTIRDEIAILTDILQNTNTLTPDMHRDSEFQTLYDEVMKKLEE